MSSFKMGTRSNTHLAKVDPKLAEVVRLALTYTKFDFGVVCSLRTNEEQLDLLRRGLTTTLKSKHLANSEGLSEAVDIVVYNEKGKHTFKRAYYSKVAQAMFKAAIELGVELEWGGHWFSLFDGPHYQINK